MAVSANTVTLSRRRIFREVRRDYINARVPFYLRPLWLIRLAWILRRPLRVKVKAR